MREDPGQPSNKGSREISTAVAATPPPPQTPGQRGESCEAGISHS